MAGLKCLDTYALVEIHDGNEDFKKYFEDDACIPSTTMSEFYAIIYRRFNLKTAEYWYKKLSFLCRTVDTRTLLNAAKFKVDSDKNYSFFDAIGYVYAQENNMDFVTGDEEFRNVEGVEFVK